MATADAFDAYYVWLGIGAEEQPAHYYRLLDVKLFETNPDVIDTGFQRRMAYLRSIKAGDRLEQAERLKNALAEARRCLLQPQKKADYDAELKKRLSAISESAAAANSAEPLSDIETVAKQLTDCGLIDSVRLEKFVPPSAHPKDVAELAAELVKAGRLTPFQAQCVAAGKAASLILGNYTLLDELGSGGMGRVYKAEHRRMHRLVALKTLPPERVNDRGAIARFEQEVAATARLSHPNIVAVHDADEAGGIHYFVMEYVDGTDLSALVKREGPLAPQKALDYIVQAARGLEFAHSQGIIHRDVKPANLLVDRKGVVKLLDLGLARLEGAVLQTMSLTGAGSMMGTVDYMSPAQAASTRSADARSDIYSLGCTLYYLLTARAVYDGESSVAKLVAHEEAPIPSLQLERSECPAELEYLFRRMVAKRPEDRPRSMKAVITEMERCVRGLKAPTLPRALPGGAPLDLDATLPRSNPPSPAGMAPPPLPFPMPLQRPATPAFRPVNAQGASLATRVRRSSRRGNPVWWMCGLGAFGLVILAGVIFKLSTREGTLLVEVNQPDAIVQVIDAAGMLEISQPGAQGSVKLSVVPGKHKIKVEKQGFEFYAADFEIAAGAELQIKASLSPIPVAPVATVPAKTNVATTAPSPTTIAANAITPTIPKPAATPTTSVPVSSATSSSKQNAASSPLAVVTLREGMHVIHDDGRYELVSNFSGYNFDVRNGLVAKRSGSVVGLLDLTGKEVSSFPVMPPTTASALSALPNRRWLLGDTREDKIYLTDESGAAATEIDWGPNDQSLQSCNCVMIGNSLFVGGRSDYLLEIDSTNNQTKRLVSAPKAFRGSASLARYENELIGLEEKSIVAWDRQGPPRAVWTAPETAAKLRTLTGTGRTMIFGRYGITEGKITVMLLDMQTKTVRELCDLPYPTKPPMRFYARLLRDPTDPASLAALKLPANLSATTAASSSTGSTTVDPAARAAAEAFRAELIGKPAFEFVGAKWLTGGPHTLAELRGKPVLLDFWAGWCGPCITSFPKLAALGEKYAPLGLKTIGITRRYGYDWDAATKRPTKSVEITPDKEDAATLEFIKHHGLKHPNAVMPSDELSKQYGLTSIPQYVLIDKTGMIRMIKTGSGDGNFDQLETEIQKLLEYDAKPTGTAPVAGLHQLYDSLKLSVVAPPRGPFRPGNKIALRFALKNEGTGELTVPDGGTAHQTIGRQTAWLKQLDSDADIPALGNKPSGEDRFSLSGSAILAKGKLAVNESVPLSKLIDTQGYPEGKYLYELEYRSLDDKVLSKASFEFELASGLVGTGQTTTAMITPPVPRATVPVARPAAAAAAPGQVPRRITDQGLMNDVYNNLRLTLPEPPPPEFQPGDRIALNFMLTNVGGGNISVPTQLISGQTLAGTQAAFIERLEPDTVIAVIPASTARQGTKYAAGGSIINSRSAIQSGDGIPIPRVLDTTGFLPGRYRYELQYRMISSSTVLHSATYDFALVAKAGRAVAEKLTVTPQLAFKLSEPYQVGGSDYVRYWLTIVNRAEIPDAMFAESPSLRAFVTNTRASRTIVTVYSADTGKGLGTVAGMKNAATLDGLWFGLKKGESPPKKVYVELHDRIFDQRHRTNDIDIPQVP